MKGVKAQFSLRRAGFCLEAELELPARGVSAIFGPSGSGKTTLLRCIAGLERAVGTLDVNGETWQDGRTFKPVHRRPLGYVFQESSLFPHLSVEDNLQYGYRRVPSVQRKVQLEEVVEWLGLGRLLARKDVNALSGGERQRVAIGRALLTSPRLLLMDEPLSALDGASKQDIFPYLKRLTHELDIPVLYVSHALEEVARLASHMVLLHGGRVVASGEVSEMLGRLDLPTAHLDETGVVIEATVESHDAAYHLTRLVFAGGELWVGLVDQPPGSTVRARILARDVSVMLQRPQGTSISNIVAARVTEIRDAGPDKVNVRLALAQGSVLLSRITRRSRDLLALDVGADVFAQVKSVVLAV